jgi:hypothetical protein
MVACKQLFATIGMVENVVYCIKFHNKAAFERLNKDRINFFYD